MQLPDSTVISDPSFKEKHSSSDDTSSVKSSSSFMNSKKSQIERSSVIFLDCDSNESDSIISGKPLNSDDSGKIFLENESFSDSPSTHSRPDNFSKKTSTYLDGSDLFFSAKKTDTPVQCKSNTPANISATEDMDQDDFYNDDFDIDDFNDSDIPEYFEEPQSSSVLGHNSSTVRATVKEGRPSTSSWDKKPATPAPAPKPSKISSPGKSAWDWKICTPIFSQHL